jgi:tetratricopeptide (TPR) repeat protein
MSSAPEQVGPYPVLRPIARGGMAEVYEVVDPFSGEHLALKLLQQTGGALPRFDREYEAMIRLNHPNIVRVYHYGLHDGKPWLTMELLEGQQVQAYAKKCGKPGTPTRMAEVLRVAHDLALALDHIHRRGLVHRDLKSANVLVLNDGRVKLLDFGTARLQNAAEAITREGEFLGTYAYASPEQVQALTVDHRADLYAFGVLLYRLTTGKMPFESEDAHQLARLQVRARPRPPSELTQLDPRLEALILTLLEKDPDRRPASGAAVADALAAVASGPLQLPGTLDIDVSSEGVVGREAQQAHLRAFLDALASPETLRPAAMVLVTGPPGSGRNRLVDAARADAVSRGWRAVEWRPRAGADELDRLRSAFLQVGQSFGHGAPPEVRAALRILEQVAISQITLAEQVEALRGAGASLLAARATADRAPLLFIVRDLDLASPVGIEALVGLREACERIGASVAILADCMDIADEPRTAIRKRFPTADRVHLPPLGEREVALFVGALLHRRPPPTLMARQIFRASGGQPGYVEEVVRGLVDEGILRIQSRDANRIEWAQREDRPIEVPPVAQERVLEQLASLPADRRRALEALALCGGEATRLTIARALGCAAGEIEPALEDLQARGWISLDRLAEEPIARWRQFLAEAVVLGQLHPARRRVLERSLSELLTHEPAFVAQIKLLLATGKVADAFLRALDWAAHHLAHEQPVTALEVLDRVAPFLEEAGTVPEAERARLALLHASALLLARPADPQLGRALGLAERLGHAERNGLLAGEVALVRARVSQVSGAYATFRKQLAATWAMVERLPPSPLSATIADQLGWSDRVSGHVEDAATWHGRARRIATQVGDPVVRARVEVGVADWQLARGLIADGERTAAQAIAVLEAHSDTHGLAVALPVWAASLRRQGRYSEAFQVLYHQAPTMRATEVPSHSVRLLLATAWCELDICRLGRAQECVDELGALLRREEHLDLRLESELVWGRILLESGEIDEARQRLEACRDRARAAGLAVLAEHAAAIAAECAAWSGQTDEAIEAYQASILALQRARDIPVLADACASRARVLSHLEVPGRLFAPVESYLGAQPALPLRVALRLAEGRYATAMGLDPSPPRDDAAAWLQQIGEALNDTDRAALRMHPWTQELRLAPT